MQPDGRCEYGCGTCSPKGSRGPSHRVHGCAPPKTSRFRRNRSITKNASTGIRSSQARIDEMKAPACGRPVDSRRARVKSSPRLRRPLCAAASIACDRVHCSTFDVGCVAASILSWGATWALYRMAASHHTGASHVNSGSRDWHRANVPACDASTAASAWSDDQRTPSPPRRIASAACTRASGVSTESPLPRTRHNVSSTCTLKASRYRAVPVWPTLRM